MNIRQYILMATCLCTMAATAQNTGDYYRNILDQAENDYRIGRFADTEKALTENLKGFPREMRQSVYRLLALSYIGSDHEEQAEEYVRQLLTENPYYTTRPDDRARFVDLVERIKAGMTATITTASSQAETLGEVPVPTTLITEQMIRDCGARNLQEVLATYVPGMYIIDCNDDINIAMRGVYSSGQEKILFMLNGHRLNSYCSNTAAPDFSISLEKLKQIEVLRGPASSLYGGVALTAVVNLITKKGADVDGIKVKGGIGNYGQFKGDIMFGKRYFDVDILLWGGLYMAKGQRRYVSKENTGMGFADGDVTIGGIGPKPSYDFGTTIKYKNLQFVYNTQFSQVQAPMTMTHTFSPYDIERYKTFNGESPSHTTISHHADLSYGQSVGNFYLKGQVAYDNSDLTYYQVISDQMLPGFAKLLPLPESSKQMMGDSIGGIGRYISGQEHTFSAKVQGDWSYVDNGVHKGLVTFGGEYSYFQLDDTRYVFVYDFIKTLPETVNISEMGKGHEHNANGFVQLKHQWGPFILNAGLRFDYKARYDHTFIRELSPRVALIFNKPKWNVKLSYAKAFIDAPYLYRKTNQFLGALMATGSNSQLTEQLTPESMHSYQLTLSATQWVKGLNMELNAFLNRTRDLIYMDFIEHYNMGNSNIYGLEFTGTYDYRQFSAYLSACWQKSNKYELFYQSFNKPFNMPEWMVNTTLAWQPTRHFRVHGNLTFNSRQQTNYKSVSNYAIVTTGAKQLGVLQAKAANGTITPEEAAQIEVLKTTIAEAQKRVMVVKDIPSYFVMDIGANYTWKRLEVALNIHNLLNNKYDLSGACTGLLPQKGRWFMVEVGYKF